MSDPHDEHGAHEIDNMPNGRLFNLLFGLSALTLIACIGVVQLFNRQLDRIESQRGEQASFQLTEYRDEMAKLKDSWGVVEITEDDGLPKPKGAAEAGPPKAVRYHMPLSEAKRRILADPKVLSAPDAYTGWKQQWWDKNPVNAPTDAGGQAAPAQPPAQPPTPTPTPVPARPAPTQPPADGKAPAAPGRPAPTPARPAPTPEGKAPADGKAEGKAPPKPPKPAKPAEGKADGKAPPKPPKPAKPADGKADGN